MQLQSFFRKTILIGFALYSTLTANAQEVFHSVAMRKEITKVQPFTGIVLWHNNEYLAAYQDAIQLEFSYMKYSDIVTQRGVYNWTALENVLNSVASRGHQAIIRFYFVYPKDMPDRDGTTTVPQYIKNLPNYTEFKGTGDGGTFCWFPDWRHTELQAFALEFYTKFAEKYDADPRLAFVQTGFGLWSEYHVYASKITVNGTAYNDEQMVGIAFPSKTFQEQFLTHLSANFKQTPWSVSINVADAAYSPVGNKPELKNLKFGLFDDSFMSESHHLWNAPKWQYLGADRYKRAPGGGEFNYYSDFDQKNVLNPNGLRGKTFEEWAAQFHISYMIGNDQPYLNMPFRNRIKEASMATGYKFKLVEFLMSDTQSKLTFTNTGVAPIYYDAYPEINGVRSTESLKGLSPGETRVFTIPVSTATPELKIYSPHLLSGQEIQFEANTSSTGFSTLSGFSLQLMHNRLEMTADCDVRLFDIHGKLAGTWHNVRNVDINAYPKGFYIALVSYEGETMRLKMLRK